MIDIDEDIWTSVNDASRIRTLGLNQSHRWVKFNGDCWDGTHSHVMCYDCMVEPFWECFHELPPTKRIKVDLEALQPCKERKA